MKRRERLKFSLAEMPTHDISAKIICTILLLHSSFDQENLLKLVKPFCVAVRDKNPAESARGASGTVALPRDNSHNRLVKPQLQRALCMQRITLQVSRVLENEN